MKKSIVSILLVVLALGFFSGTASAQMTETVVGSMHVYMVAALADALNLTDEQVDARLIAGETMVDIALAEGIAEADLPAFLTEVRTAAVNDALADGVITRTQADRMLQGSARARMGTGFGMGSRMGTGTGTCTGTGTGIPLGLGSGMHGGGRWQTVNP